MDVENTQTEPQETTEAAPEAGEVSRDELIAVAQAATEAEAKAGAEGTQPTTETAAPEADDPTEKLASVLRAREAARAKRLEADDYAQRLKAQADQDRQRIIDEARAEAKRQADAELAELRAKYRSSPTATIRALAEDGNVQSVVDDVLREGTPEARALAQAREEARLAREDAKVGKSAAEELAKFKADQARERQEATYAAIRTSFLNEHASAEKAPYMHARWEPEEVFDRCNKLCHEWEKDGLKLDIDFDRKTLVAYLEKESRERYSNKVPGLTSAQQSGAGTPSKESGLAPKSAANGTRTITAASGSERRASPKPFNELTPAEQREDLIRVAREAYRQHGKP